jgi:hypothetical protein
MVNFRKTVRKICFCCGKRKYETKSPEEDNKDFGGIEKYWLVLINLDSVLVIMSDFNF